MESKDWKNRIGEAVCLGLLLVVIVAAGDCIDDSALCTHAIANGEASLVKEKCTKSRAAAFAGGLRHGKEG